MKLRHTAIAACLLAAPFAMAQTGTTMPPGHPSTMPAGHGSMSSTRHDAATIRHVQQELTRAGYDAGPADGVMGPKTRAALADYQRSKGISANGLDNSTLSALGVSSSAGGTSPGSSSAPGEGTLGSAPNQQPRPGGTAMPPDRSTGATGTRAGSSKGEATSPGEGALGSSPSQTNPSRSTAPADAVRNAPADTTRPATPGTSPSNPATPSGPSGGSK